MNGLLAAPNGMNLQDAVIGWDIQPFGFGTFREAMETWDDENPPIGQLFKVQGSIYQVIEENGKPKFHFWDVR